MDVSRYPAVESATNTAGDIMSSPAITIPAGSTRARIAKLLTQHQVSGVPVVDEVGRVVGLVTKGDLLAKSGGDVGQLMTTDVISVSVDTPLEDVRHLLIDRQIRRVSVLREGQLVGVVSRGDLAATMAIEWVCEVCGEPVRGSEPLEMCPKCHAGPERFTHQEQPPGD